MVARRSLAFVLVSVFASMGASYPTTNFLVDAPTPQIAQQVGQWAEHYRKEKAQLWLGQEMPNWPERCPLKVTVTMGGAGGATSFEFHQGQYPNQHMHIEGSLDRLLNSVLPHEVTHTVFAHYFRCPVPRWADEGGAVLSEDDAERNRHDALARQLLASGRAFPLRRLFALREYPNDVMTLYAEGYSVVHFLVSNSNRTEFLAFIAQGMREGWDRAAQTHFHYKNVDELEQAWISNLKETRRPPAMLARNTAPAEGNSAERVVVRQTVPPAQPLVDAPRTIYRGQAPTTEQEGERFGGPAGQPDPSSGVRLGPPEFTSPPPDRYRQSPPGWGSPAGYPR